MAIRKPSKPSKSSAKEAKPSKASASNWQSVTPSFSRRAIYGGKPQDQRMDFSQFDRIAMLKKCRQAERDSGLFKQIITDICLYGVGDGIIPQSHASDKKVAMQYEDYFARKSKVIDITGRFSFYQSQNILLRAMVRDGDSFAAKVRNASGEAKLQLMEAHRVGNPMDGNVPSGMYDGVGFGAYGELKYFNVYRSDGSDRQILASSMMHIVDHEYASGARGVPLLQHSLNSIQDEQEILALEKTAVKDSADITRVLTKSGGQVSEDVASEISSGGSSCSNIASQMGGKLIVVDQGEDLKSMQSNRPSPTFTGFLAALERDIAQGVLPYEFVGDSSKLGGATVRLVTAKAARVFGKYQTILINSFCNPTWAYIIADGIDRGEIPDDPDWNRVSWTTPKSVTVDAGRDAANDRNDVEMGLMSMSELYAQRGLDFRAEMEKRANDMSFIVEKARDAKIPIWMLYKPDFNWLQQGQRDSQIPMGTAENLDLPPPPQNP